MPPSGIPIASPAFLYPSLMEGPERKISVFNPTHDLRQIGWLGFTGVFYPVYCPMSVIHEHEKGGYSPVYMEVGD